MSKSLFARMLVVYLLIILMTFSLLGGLLFETMKSQYFDAQMNTMIAGAQEINQWSTQYHYGEITEQDYCQKLFEKANSDGTVIWLVSAAFGQVDMIFDPQEKSNIEIEFSSNSTREFLMQTQRDGTYKRVSNVDKSFKGTVMTVAIPLKINRDIVGAIVIHKEVDDVGVGLSAILRQVFMLLLGSVTFAFALVFVLSRHIVRPIRDISRGAMELSRGNLDWRVTPTTQDEIGELAESFNKMAEELKIQDGLRNTFIANVSHELRTPLASVQGFIQGMLDRAIEEDDRDKYLEIVLSETKRMNLLISDLLSLAKIESGKFPMEYSEFDINELLRRCLLMFEQRIEEKHLEVSIKLGDNRLAVWADQDRISQVITNLVDNAVKFTPEGGRLSVWTQIKGNKVFIHIADTGVGIPEEDQPFIFERFFKVDKSHTKSIPGTGIGLSIVKRIIAQHGEKISLESKEGEGTTFAFTLTCAFPEKPRTKQA